MKTIVQHWKLFLLFLFLLMLFIISIYNLSNKKQFNLSFRKVQGVVYFNGDFSMDNSGLSVIRDGDVCISLDDHPIYSKQQAEWIIMQHIPPDSLEVTFQHDDQTISIKLSGTNYYTLLNILLIFILSGFFILTSLALWWYGAGDPTALSFARLMMAVGTAFLLADHANVYRSSVIHCAYSCLWMAAYSLIPAALLNFSQHFLNFKIIPFKRKLNFVAPVVPSVIFTILISFTYIKSYITLELNWIHLWHVYFLFLISSYLIISFTTYIIMLLKRYISPASATERNKLQWILLISLIGLLPFFVLYKIPMFLGFNPLIPLWTSQALMVIVPLGWGMSVASFRLFRVEWVLSRMIIYVTITILFIYLLTLFAVLSSQYFVTHNSVSLALLITIGVITIYIVISGLVSQITKVVDRLYYHDWYNYHKEFQSLSLTLSRTIDADTYVHLLTARLPQLLQVTESVLVEVLDNAELALRTSGTRLSQEESDAVLLLASEMMKRGVQLGAGVHDMSELVSQNGTRFEYIVPLYSSGRVGGLLILGPKLSGAPLSIQDRRLLIELSIQAGISLENVQMQKKLVETELLKQDIKAAAGIMRLIIPQTESFPKVRGVEVCGYSYPCKEVGGDYLDVMETNDGRLAFLISDVSGKGLHASLLVSNLQASCQVLFKSGLKLEVIMSQINRILCHNSTSEQFVTCFAGIINPENGSVEIINAGHNLPYVVHMNGIIEKIEENELLLGVFEKIQYSSAHIKLEKGDILYLYTDGITEAFDENGIEYGEQRLVKLLETYSFKGSVKSILKEIERDVCRYCGVKHPENGFPHDDVTHLCICYSGMNGN